jgi:hypothetical protein
VRIVNRVLAAVLGLALLVGGLLTAAEIVVAGSGRRPWVIPHDDWYRSARARSWDSAPPRWIFIGLVIAGLGLLAAQVARRRPTSLDLAPAAVPADLGRRSLERALAREATRVDGVAGVKVKVDATKAEVIATTNRRQTAEVQPHLAAALDRRIGSLGLARPPAVQVKVHSRSGT